ncbi:MAG TPA: hypothetical protein VIT23_14805 [Terrimicrobiaceae bacterium]
MNNAATSCGLVALLTVVACIARGDDIAKGHDTIFLNHGEKFVGKITSFDGKNIRLQRSLPPAVGSPVDGAPIVASVTVSRAYVKQVEFCHDQARDEKLSGAMAATTTELEALWKEALPWLTIPRSPAGEIGLSYANVLLSGGNFENGEKALRIFKMIEADAWSGEVVTRAREGRLRAMMVTGSAQEAIDEAREIERTTNDPAVLLEAKFILAQAAEKALRSFVTENPRWQEDPFAIPQRNRLYEEALELYLYPSLFFGSEIDPAARGLWGAVEVFRFAGDLRQAIEASRDLVTIYPETSHAKQALAFLKTVPDPTTKKSDDPPAKP